jgi:hypothetical protein
MKTSSTIQAFVLVQVLSLTHCFASECDVLIGCMESISGTPIVLEAADKDEACNFLLEAYGGSAGVTAVCDVADLMSSNHARKEKEVDESSNDHEKTRFLTAPTCQVPVDPQYADESGTGTGYDTAVASIETTFIQDGKSQRTNDDAVGSFIIGLFTARTADAAFTACDAIVNVATFGVCLAAKTIAAVLTASLEIVYEQIGFHDGGIDSTEIKAAYENTGLILSQTCSIISQTDSFETNVVTRFNTVDSTLSTFQTDVATRFTTVDSTLTTFQTDVATRFTTVDTTLAAFEANVVGRFGAVDATLAAFEANMITRLDQVDDAIAEFRAENEALFRIVRILLTTPEGKRTGYNTQVCDSLGIECPLVNDFP